MKFNQLKIGQRFHYRNADYTKTGPLQAVADGSSNSQLIIRAASVQPLNEEKGADPSRNENTNQLRQAIDKYHSECKAILRTTTADADLINRLEMRYQELVRLTITQRK